MRATKTNTRTVSSWPMRDCVQLWVHASGGVVYGGLTSLLAVRRAKSNMLTMSILLIWPSDPVNPNPYRNPA